MDQRQNASVAYLAFQRRAFVILGGVAVAWPFAGFAQQNVMPVVGYLNGTSAEAAAPFVGEFRKALTEVGYVEGKSLAIEYRWAQGNYDRLPSLAAELVARNVNVIVASGGDRSSVAAKGATTTIPIVSVIGGDPVASGFVSSLGHPGGNLTGVSLTTVELMPKRLELLAELVPRAKEIGLLVNPDNPQTADVMKNVEQAAQLKRTQLDILKASSAAEIDSVFAGLPQKPVSALVIQADPFFIARRDQLVALASHHALPAIAEWRGFPDGGGLISYGTSLTGVYHQIGDLVGRILKGAKPADLPVQQPTKFELVINLKAAKALGLTVPQTLLARADEVIE